MSLEIIKYHPKETFKRKEVDCILCLIRQKLIKLSPEEIIRQAFVKYLINEKSIPKEQIEIEIPLSRINKGDKKRADIIVYGDYEKKNIVLVIECKKNTLSIIDRNIEQVKKYNSTFNANYIIVTNGIDYRTYEKTENDYKELSIIPNYKELRDNHSLQEHIIIHETYQRHSLKEISHKRTHDFLYEWGHIGIDTPKEHYPFLSNLIDFIFDEKTTFENLQFNGIKIIKDLGTKDDSFGNGGGGNWTGEYKKLLVQDKSNNHLTIGIAILAKGKFENDTRFGNTKGHTYLIVSIDDFDKSHNSLQLNLDKHLSEENNHYTINHDGKLSNGHNGSIKNSIVKDYIIKNAPYLITNNKIQLGILSNNTLITHHDKNAIQFIKNLIEYSILRDEVRRGER